MEKSSGKSRMILNYLTLKTSRGCFNVPGSSEQFIIENKTRFEKHHAPIPLKQLWNCLESINSSRSLLLLYKLKCGIFNEPRHYILHIKTYSGRQWQLVQISQPVLIVCRQHPRRTDPPETCSTRGWFQRQSSRGTGRHREDPQIREGQRLLLYETVAIDWLLRQRLIICI